MDRDTRRGLNWGCGPDWAEHDVRWICSDVVDYGQHHVGDIANGLPWGDDSFDGIVANHSLQCLPWNELEPALLELRRVLRPGGALHVLVPDVLAAFHAFEHEDPTWPGFVAISEPWGLARKLCHYVTWGGQNRSVFTQWTLIDLLERTGFSVVRATTPGFEWMLELDSRLDESIWVQAIR